MALFDTKAQRWFARADRLLRDDDGSAMLVAMAVATIGFMLGTMLLSLTLYQSDMDTLQESRTASLHMADAGINAYLYELRRDPDYFVDNPQLGPTTLDDGVWTVQATAPTDEEPLTLHATGGVPSRNVTSTVVATVRFPTFADYMFLANADLNIGAHAVIEGKIRSNGDISNDGRVTGKATAAGSVSGSGDFEDGYEENQPVVDFTQVLADMDMMRQTAQASNTHFGQSGDDGYLLTINGASINVYRITGGTGSGNLTTQPVRSFMVPADGVVFFEDDVYVRGAYDTNVTVASARSLYIIDDWKRMDADGTYTSGLIAESHVIVPTWYPSIPENLEIQAALLAHSGAVYGDLRYGSVKTSLVIDGSMAYSDYGYFASYQGNTVVAGFRQRDYRYDLLLDLRPPPMYPIIRDGSLKVSTWVEG